MSLPEVNAFCAGCRQPIALEEVQAAVTVHPSPGLWCVVLTFHPDPECFRLYWLNRPPHLPQPSLDALTVGDLEASGVFRLEAYGDDRGYARLRPIREVAA
ncbi:MAG: hypothetical protein M3R38_09725 [Actinomycetota bacterium]|nr:hypothetical protein [Actinomycetota bacterium]